MNDELKQKIAADFPITFEQSDLGISISDIELDVFEKGIFSSSMDDKWNIFVLNDILHFSRSWTNHCIFKVHFERVEGSILLKDFLVNRNIQQYRSVDVKHDAIVLKKLIQGYLNRDDLYSDPTLELPLIRQIIDKGKYHDFIKSIGSNDVGLTRKIHQALTSQPNRDFFDVKGWYELEKNLSNRLDAEPLISLYVQHKQSKEARTFYFDKDATQLLGEIVILKKANITLQKY